MALFFGDKNANTLVGFAADDAIFGFGGNDILRGFGGNDGIAGGGGNDEIDGGSGNDALDGGAGDDEILGGNGNDFIDGGDGTNTLDGGSGSDTLVGGTGFDLLIGGLGTDILDGGDGSGDRYVFNTTAETVVGAGRDLIVFFNDVFSQDRIDLSGIDANTGAAGNQAFVFTNLGTAAFTAPRQIKVFQDPANLSQYIIQLNTDNLAGPNAEIAVVTDGILDASDFIL